MNTPAVDGFGAAAAGFGAAIVAAALPGPTAPFLALVVLAAVWLGLAGRVSAAQPAPVAPLPPPEHRVPVSFRAIGVVVLLTIVAYLPPALARYGPLGEDKYLFSAALRALDGQQPYADFEFLYGPLVIVPAVAWLRSFGYVLQSYYWLLALVEAATFALLFVALGRLVPGRRERLLLFGLAVLLLLNDNLGLSWIALRRLLPVAAIVVYGIAGGTRRGWSATVGMLGVTFALSLEFAIAALAAVGAIGLIEAWLTRTPRPLLRACAAVLAGIGAGLLLGTALLGAGVIDWLRATLAIILERSGGEAGFPFQFSVNAVAVFAVLFLGVGRIGRGLRSSGAPPGGGDRVLVGGVAYALIALKSGFGRADMYHLVPPILGVLAGMLLPLAVDRFPLTPPARRATAAVVLLLVATWIPGLAGTGRIWAEGWVHGVRDLVTGAPPSAIVPRASRAPHLLHGRSANRAELVALAEWLASAEGRGPLVYYGRSWGLDRMIGAPKPIGVYPTDDYLVTDAVGASIGAYLDATPEALVLIDGASWREIEEGAPPAPIGSMFWIGGRYSLPVRFLERWSSAHFGTAVVDEEVRKRERWARTVGPHLVARFAPVATFGEWLVLGPRG